MNRADLQALSRLREAEAATLLQAGQYHGAYYLIGYAIECALKARIAKRTQRYDFPERDFAVSVFTHDLERLMRLAGLLGELEADVRRSHLFELNWGIVKEWNEAARYRPGITESEARNLIRACTERANGILPWVRKRW